MAQRDGWLMTAEVASRLAHPVQTVLRSLQDIRSRSHSSNSKEATTFSRCCLGLMGRMIVVVGNENDLDYPCSMRHWLVGEKVK